MSVITMRPFFNYFMFNQDMFDLVKHYKERLGEKRLHSILLDCCLIFEPLEYGQDSYNKHEDLLDAGFVLGYEVARTGGKIMALKIDNCRYYFVGKESEIYYDVKFALKSVADKHYTPIHK